MKISETIDKDDCLTEFHAFNYNNVICCIAITFKNKGPRIGTIIPVKISKIEVSDLKKLLAPTYDFHVDLLNLSETKHMLCLTKIYNNLSKKPLKEIHNKVAKMLANKSQILEEYKLKLL